MFDPARPLLAPQKMRLNGTSDPCSVQPHSHKIASYYKTYLGVFANLYFGIDRLQSPSTIACQLV